MSIKFRCDNLASYDAQQKKYVNCGEVITVEDSMEGHCVECPACGNQIDVPLKSAVHIRQSVTQKSSSQDPATTASKSLATKATSPELESPKSKASKEAKHKSQPESQRKQAMRPKSKPSAKSDDFSLGPPEKLAETGTAVDSFGEIQGASNTFSSNTLANSRFTRGNTCGKCGARISKGQTNCTTCGKPLPAHISRVEQPMEIRHRRTGFILWLSSLFSSADSQHPSAALPILHTVGGLALATIAAIFVIFGGLLGIFFAILLLIPAVAYFLTLRKWHEFETNPLAVPYGWQRFLWNLLLGGYRAVGWQNPFLPGGRRFVLDLREASIQDEDLHSIDGIGHAKVVDLEGLPITDDGLINLRDRKQIRFLVLRRTQVTVEGVFKLQQILPRTWIWT